MTRLYVLCMVSFVLATDEEEQFNNPCEVNNGGCQQGCVQDSTIGHYCTCDPGFRLKRSATKCWECTQRLDIAVLNHQYISSSAPEEKHSFITSVLDELHINNREVHIDVITHADDVKEPFLTSDKIFRDKLSHHFKTVSLSKRTLSSRMRLMRKRFIVQDKKRNRSPNLAVMMIEHNYDYIAPHKNATPVYYDMEFVMSEASLIEEEYDIPIVVIEIRNGPALNDMLNFMDATTDVSAWWSIHNVTGLQRIIPQVKQAIHHYTKVRCAESISVCTDTSSHGRQCRCYASQHTYSLNGTQCTEGVAQGFATMLGNQTSETLLVIILVLMSVNIVLVWKMYYFIKRHMKYKVSRG